MKITRGVAAALSARYRQLGIRSGAGPAARGGACAGPQGDPGQSFSRGLGRSLSPGLVAGLRAGLRTGLSGTALWLGLAGFATLAMPGAGVLMQSAHAQTTKIPVLDGTPDVDASIANKQWTQALDQIDARLKTNPQDAQAKFKRATVLARLGRDDEAIAALLALTQEYPELPEPYNNLAALYAKHGQYDNARATLETAVAANPAFSLAYQNLGSLYLKLAQDAYTHASSIDKRDAESRVRAGRIHAILSPAAPASGTKAVAPVSASGSASDTKDESEPALPTLPTPSIMPSGGSQNNGGLPPSPQRND
jgi:Flp pilus assembly protein TadD